MNEVYDALIVGAGPAGIATSIELGRLGWKVLLIDKSAFPRNKVCGGFIGPENKELLSRYGILDDMMSQGAKKVTHILLSAPSGDAVHVPLRYSGCNDFGLGFSRKNMDDLLLRCACEAGVNFLEAAVIGHCADDGGLCRVQIRRTNGKEHVIVRSAHIIYAAGAGQNQDGSNARLFGVAGLFDSCGGINSDVVMHFIDGGHVGINAFEGGNINVCYVIKQDLFRKCQGKYESIWENFLNSSPPLRRQMGSAKLIGQWKGTFIDMDRPQKFFDGQAFYAGDAAGLIHPVAGGGISMALNCGIILGQLMGQHHPRMLPKAETARQYETMWRRLFQRPVSVSKWIGSLSHYASASNLIIKLLKARERTIHNMFDIFHQPALVPPFRRVHGLNKDR